MLLLASRRAWFIPVLLFLLCHSPKPSRSWTTVGSQNDIHPFNRGRNNGRDVLRRQPTTFVPTKKEKARFSASPEPSSRSEGESTRSVTREEADDGGTTAVCPFRRTLRRYRIDLSSIKSTNTRKTNNFLLGGMTKAWTQPRLEQQGYQWMKGYSDLEAFCHLWSTAATLSSTYSNDEATPMHMAMAFPDAAPRVIQHWVDVLEWIQDYEDQVQSAAARRCRLQAEFTVDSEIPCIKLASIPSSIDTRVAPAVAPSNWDPTVIERQTQLWVQRLLVDLSICPFTKSTRWSGQGLADVGVPVGRIAYHTSNASTMIPLLADAWRAMADMIAAGPKGKTGISSILLAAPHYDNDFELWAGPVFATLETSVVAVGLESQLGVVCFHPHYATPDGSTFPGFGHMHSVPRLEQWVRETQPDFSAQCNADDIAAGGAWQRRTPHATINVLRADQLQAAESKRNTPQMYARNIQTLLNIGNEQLQTDLEREQAVGMEINPPNMAGNTTGVREISG